MVPYENKEIKVLDVNVSNLCSVLEEMGAIMVFEDERIRTSYDNAEETLIKKGLELRITEEGTTKLSLDETNESGERTSIKLKISRSKEMEDILAKLNIKPVSRVKSNRISYELGSIDFDIDTFPNIPSFVEIDFAGEDVNVSEYMAKLGLAGYEVFVGSTIELYGKYGKDFVETFRIQ